MKLYCCIDDFWKALDNGGWLSMEPAMWLEGWNFVSHHWEGEWGWRLSSITSDPQFNQLCLCNEASTKTQKNRIQRASLLANTWKSEKGDVLGKGLKAFPIPCPMHLFHLAAPELCPFICCLVSQLCPWDFPGKNTGVGCHFFIQGIFPTQGSICVSCLAGRFFYHWATWEVHTLLW